MPQTTLAVCLAISQLMGSLEDKREREGYTLQETQSYISENQQFSSEVKRRLGMISVIMYALPKGSDYSGLELQVNLQCGNKRARHGQYPHEGSRRGTRGSEGDEFYRRRRTEEAWVRRSK